MRLQESILGLLIPADSLNTSLGIGLSIALKGGVKLLVWWGQHSCIQQGFIQDFPQERANAVIIKLRGGVGKGNNYIVVILARCD